MEEITSWNGKKLIEAVKKYRYALLVLGVGVLLMLLPTGKERERNTSTSALSDTSSWAEYDLAGLEKRLSEVLSTIKGVGRAEIVLTVEAGSRRILAQDVEDRTDSLRSTAVILSTGSGKEEVVTTQIISPVFQGALVVCEGGDDPTVRLEVLHAVEAVTGLRADRITVCKAEKRER